MSEQLGLPASTLSFHLKELANAGLVSQQRDGRYLISRAAFEQMTALLGYLTENCSKARPACRQRPANPASPAEEPCKGASP